MMSDGSQTITSSSSIEEHKPNSGQWKSTEDVGPDIGSLPPAFAVQTVEGVPLASVSNDDRQTMLLFISLSCSTCSSLLRGLRTVAKGERDAVRFVVVMRDDPARRDYTGDLPELAALRTHVSIVLSSSLFEQYSITGTPYAVLLTSGGVVANKGIVNDISHIESLIPEPTRKDIYAT
jgi:methylamine dehydrogenase accessory protein MauD